MLRTLRSLGGLIVLLFTLAACSGRLAAPGPEQPLIVGLPADPVFQQPSAPTDGMEGYSYDLVRLFAAHLGVEVRFVTAANHSALIEMVRDGKVHFAAALPALRGDPQLRYTPALRETRQVIVQHESALPVDSPEKLAGRTIVLMKGSPQAATLAALNITPSPNLIELEEGDELTLLGAVAQRRYELVASDDLHFAVAANHHPELEVAFELPARLAYVWAFHTDQEALRERAVRFIESVAQDGTLRRLDDRYFGHIHRLSTKDITAFLEHTRSRLPHFRKDFQKAQEITGIDWRLLAALAYQESMWNPLATSPTGVRGIMMLTEETADRLGVGNRLDPRQSILAGAKYLAMLLDDLPPEIPHPDRLWFALAAYNLGMGHLNGARQFAPGLKKDPNSWTDMKQVMPLMMRPEYYSRLKSGRARGGEAVIMVENIRNYYDVLARLEPAYTPSSFGEASARKKARKSTGRA